MSVRYRMLSHRSHRAQMGRRQGRHTLEAEIGTFTSAADRADLEGLLVRYDDQITADLRDILVRQQARMQRAADRRWRTVGGL